jgi:hypothetical protein
MKKKAILLLTLVLTITLFYNVVGYYLMYAFEKEQTWVHAKQNIAESEFKVIRLNASLYSFTEDTEMEYVNENITIKNVTYHIFKKKIENNIINLYYLRNNNQDSSTIKLEKIADSQIFNGTSSNKNPLKKIVKSGFEKYVFEKLGFEKTTIALEFKKLKIPSALQEELHSGYLTISYTPPEIA